LFTCWLDTESTAAWTWLCDMAGLRITTFDPKSGAPDEAMAVVATAPVVTIDAPATIAPVTRIECNRERNARIAHLLNY
jgi:hypothetical protein